MDIQTYLKQHRITRTDKVVLNKFRQDAFDEKGMKAVVYENADYYHLRISVPFDFNEKGRWAIEWGEWLKSILAIQATAFGVDMLVQVSKGGTCNILMNNPEKPFTHPDYPKLPIIAPPAGELTLKL
jgi:hypothetical protein